MGHPHTSRDRVASAFHGLKKDASVEDFWALKDVSFDVQRGEVLGVIGANGAGKSTLLKILSRITEPTSGEIVLRGRVASLLEVGTGFHPELTGRENIYLNGVVLGMKRREIARKYDEIVAFSGVDKFLDTPVKRYSSGMYVRLAFAVAAHLEPEILIVDEVLAVGDSEFQKKCLGKMKDVAGNGRTVLFVSHNMTAVSTLCTRALLIAKGCMVMNGKTPEVTARYLAEGNTIHRALSWDNPSTAPGNNLLRIKGVRVTPDGGNDGDIISMKSAILVETDYWVQAEAKVLHITYHMMNEQGVTVLTTGARPMHYEKGVHSGSFTIPGELLNSGDYYLKLLIVENENHVIYEHDNLVSFSVVDMSKRDSAYMGREPGVIQPPLPWSLDKNKQSAINLML